MWSPGLNPQFDQSGGNPVRRIIELGIGHFHPVLADRRTVRKEEGRLFQMMSKIHVGPPVDR